MCSKEPRPLGEVGQELRIRNYQLEAQTITMDILRGHQNEWFRARDIPNWIFAENRKFYDDWVSDPDHFDNIKIRGEWTAFYNAFNTIPNSLHGRKLIEKKSKGPGQPYPEYRFRITDMPPEQGRLF